MPIIIAIDPGLSGAVAKLDTDTGELTCFDIPTHELKRGGKTKRECDLVALASLLSGPAAAMVYVEQVGAMPGQGVSSVFAFGKVYGSILGILAALHKPVTLVTPQKWKAALSVPAAKDGARARASQLMPEGAPQWKRVKDDGRAEAALIAYWGAFRDLGLPMRGRIAA